MVIKVYITETSYFRPHFYSNLLMQIVQFLHESKYCSFIYDPPIKQANRRSAARLWQS